MNRVSVNQTLEPEGDMIINTTSEEGVMQMETGETTTVASETEIIDNDTKNTEAVDMEATDMGTDAEAADAENSASVISNLESTTDGVDVDAGEGVNSVEGENSVEEEAQDNADIDLSEIEQDGLEEAISMEKDFLDGEMIGDPSFEEGMYMDPGMEAGMAEVKDPLLSSWTFVIGVSVAVLFVSIALGAFLAKRKIKKGIDLYED